MEIGILGTGGVALDSGRTMVRGRSSNGPRVKGPIIEERSQFPGLTG